MLASFPVTTKRKAGSSTRRNPCASTPARALRHSSSTGYRTPRNKSMHGAPAPVHLVLSKSRPALARPRSLDAEQGWLSATNRAEHKYTKDIASIRQERARGANCCRLLHFAGIDRDSVPLCVQAEVHTGRLPRIIAVASGSVRIEQPLLFLTLGRFAHFIWHVGQFVGGEGLALDDLLQKLRLGGVLGNRRFQYP